MESVHSLLKRQLKRSSGGIDMPPKKWQRFIQGVNDAYVAFDQDRLMLERSLDLSSKELFRANADMSAVINSSVDGIIAFDRECRYTVWNPGMERITGVLKKDLLGRSISEIFPVFRETGEEESLYESLTGKTIMVKDKPYVQPGTGKRGYFEGYYSPMRNELGEIIGGLAIFRDITKRIEAEIQLRHSALHDTLTGLANRSLFSDHLEHAIALRKRLKDYQFAVLFIDLDRFKVINDSLGHVIGDKLLTEVANRLKNRLRKDNVFSRLGGDEFAILIEHIDGVKMAKKISRHILQTFEAPFNVEGREIYITASIGITVGGTKHNRPEDLLRDADNAMYRAKAQGRARHEMFTEEMHNEVIDTLRIETDLRRAIERAELRLHYQPIMCISTGQISGCEVLMRWQHSDRGFISPAQFIPLAEETGLIVPMSEWLFHTAVPQYRTWLDAGYQLPYIALNCSARQFQRRNMIRLAEKVLEKNNIPPHSLMLEVTESLVMEDLNLTTATLHELSRMGIKLSLDDFGTGFSSLSYLQRFPIETVKIDKSFIEEITSDMDSVPIVLAIIKMAHSLKLKVVAEGVETKGQFAFLKANRCDAMQGNHFSKPLSSEAFSDFLRKECFLRVSKARIS
ncbi:MAG: EAL domain-containing protein [Waddliaceae bacterium]